MRNTAERQPPIRIPFNRPSFVGDEMTYMAKAVDNGHLSGDGEFTRRCASIMERALGVPKVLLTTSATHALELSAILLNIGPGDEVIVPSFTFVSTANAFVARGATPVFVDVRHDTLNLDERAFESAITPRTRAVVPVHYAGVSCEMDALLEIAGRYGLAVIEDNAHGLFAKYRGRHLGTFGALAVQSFHETKNFMCGEGGALIINDAELVQRAEIIREKGTDRSRFFRGEIDRYTWVDVGSSYLPSDLLSAVLCAQLEARERVYARRRRIWDTYAVELENWAQHFGVRMPVVPAHCDQSYLMFHLVMASPRDRDSLIAFLRARGIAAVFHYLPLHASPMGARFPARACPVAEDISTRLLRLPFYTDLSPDDLTAVIEAVREWTP